MAGTEAGGRKNVGTRVHRGLGRGLGALIGSEEPTIQKEETRPVDILFPPSNRLSDGQKRSTNSAKTRELLTSPLRTTKGRKSEESQTRSKQAESEKTGKERLKPPSSIDEVVGENSDVSREASKDVARGIKDAAEGNVSRETLQKSALKTEEDLERIAPRAAASKLSEAVANGVNENVSRETLENSTPANADSSVLTPNAHPEESENLAPELVTVPGVTFGELRIDQIIANTRQPREVFDQDELAELAASIQEVGVLQPVVVRPIDLEAEPSNALREALEERPNARFELVMGERRLRASELAGKETIPAIIRRTEDGDLLRDALLENLHRAQLNPLEEANAYQQLMSDFGATQEQLSVKIARSRPQIANTLRLLNLPPTVQRKVAAGVLSAGHARALLGLKNSQDMETLAERVVAEGLSVRTTEELVKLGNVRRSLPTQQRSKTAPSAVAEEVANELSNRWDTRVTVSEGKRKGKIVIEFAGLEDLERLAALILKPETN